ncbi:PREDICTED: uncharacterized protein LOC105958153 [Erythranthe guttata]|uniref:uncharacterized protein LOC105958153 n=1 Tax=Erythranthe guttata TaxID=4155 RepID=UPI00064DB238|nr:PREDICTED: uncharacterized protein LOC105958153 [Erythranthe guttata]|eukprot:XP_012837617.1 PREDICTED: uncharacterized protein LOC105958153 [Erythranthe guttata]
MSVHGISALNEAEVKIIKDLSQSHVPPKKILANFRQNGLGLDVYLKQIYNEKAKLRRLARGDRTMMQHLIGLLEEHNYYKWFRTDETTHAVIDLIWAHPLSVELLSKFPYVILLEIVGDCLCWRLLKRLFPPHTLPSALVTDCELGLLKAIENVFPTVPHLLCLWHINMNKILDRNYRVLVDDYANHPQLIEYLQDTWLIYKEKIVKAWTDLVFHLGNTSTSRNHKALKRWLDSSTGGFDIFWAQYHTQIADQLNVILAEFAKSKGIWAQTINVLVFKILSSGIVTHSAQKMLDDEKE